MEFDTKRFAIAVASAWSIWYTLCAFLVAVAAEQVQAVFSFAMHYDLTGNRPITWPSFFGGLVLTTAWVGAFAATAGGFSMPGAVRGSSVQHERRTRRSNWWSSSKS
jgi:hypothetical protein